MSAKPSLAEVNALAPAAFVNLLGPVWEHAAWIASAVAGERPFASVDALHGAMLAKIHALSKPEQDAFLSHHPDLAGAEAQAGTMTAASMAEQGALSLTGATVATLGWGARNADYRARFGFPFILCLRRHCRASAEAAYDARFAQSQDEERSAALAEIAHISRLRLSDRLEDPKALARPGRIVVTATNSLTQSPAEGLAVQLIPASPELPTQKLLIDASGQGVFSEVAGPLRIGVYTLELGAAEYFAAPFPSLPALRLPLVVIEPESILQIHVALSAHAFDATSLPSTLDPSGERAMKEIA